MASGRTRFKDLLRPLMVRRSQPCRYAGRSYEFFPKLKEMLNPPPPPKSRPKSLPKLEDIKIPKRIERGATDVLKALGSTVGRDYTAAHYKYHDDPFLIPYSNLSKRSYALSKEAGRKAAKWIRDQHADLFQHREAEPPVEAFWPSQVFNEDMDLSETELKEYVEQGMYQESIKLYNVLKTKGVNVSDETKQSMLEMMCYFNGNEPIEEEWIEERWYKGSSQRKERERNTWKVGGLADTIFESIEEPTVATYCAMIRGQAKYYGAEKAWVTYQDIKSKGLVLDTETYNSLLRVVNFLRENADLRFALLEEMLVEMKGYNIKPNLGTLNAILDTLSMSGNPKLAKNVALQTLSEFKALGIEPSLASYYYLLIAFCKERGPVSTILIDIMRHIKGKEFTIRDPRDTFFFVMAMDVARNHIQNLEVAYEIDELLHTGNNYDLIGDSFMESVYYRHFMALRCQSEPFDEFMKWYSKIVPNIYTPEPGIMEEILKAVEINTATTYIPQLWSDIVIFDQQYRENILSLLLNIMATYYPSDVDDLPTLERERLGVQFTDISWKIWEAIEGQDRERSRITNWTGKMLGDLLILQIKGAQFNNAGEIIRKLLQPESAAEVVGVPPLESLKVFLDAAIEMKNGAMCLACLQYMAECGFSEVRQFGEEVFSKIDNLDELQTSKLSSITGENFNIRMNKEASESSS